MDAVEDIKGRLAIEDVVGRYVELKRAGRNFRGLSPFSSEKTPSFMVSPEKQIWHDFSSGKGGNMFSFVMEMEGLDFKGALELLARQAGIDLSQYRSGYDAERGKEKERLYEALELAAKFYQIHFSKTPPAYEYILKKRGYTKKTALDFRIGYSPSNDNELSTFLLKKGFTEDEIKRAGLGRRYQQMRDMFRGRIMIPLQDQQGRVIGFTARLLRDEPGAPKYINTPQTPLYDKSRHVFGLHLAKEAIRKNNYAVVVEGNMDVIASHQAGVLQTVATAGTAMTEQHLKILGRFSHDVRLAFDQDSAGLQAAERAIPLAAKADISLSIITVPGSKDPDELIQKDPAKWEQIIQKPQYALDWLIERYQKELDITTAQGKRQFSDILLKVIKALTDSVEQDHYITELAKIIDVSPDALRDKLKTTGSGERKIMRKVPDQPELDSVRVEQVKAQNQLLALMLLVPKLRTEITSVDKTMLPEKPAQQLLVFLQKTPDFSLKKDQKKLPPETGDYVKILLLLYEQLYQGLEILELHYEAARLQTRLIDSYVKVKKGELSAQMREADEDQMAVLLKEAKGLDILLNSTKGATSG